MLLFFFKMLYSFCCLENPSIHLSNYNKVQMNVSYSNFLQKYSQTHTTLCQSKEYFFEDSCLSLFGFSVSWGKEELYENLTNTVSDVLSHISQSERPHLKTQWWQETLIYSSGMLIKRGIQENLKFRWNSKSDIWGGYEGKHRNE